MEYNIENLLSIEEGQMVPRIETVGAMPWREFDRRCRRIVMEMAQAVLKEMPRAAIQSKPNYAGVAGADVVTSADLAAQRLFVARASSMLPPGTGWIGEENGLRKASDLRVPVVVTVDPADGTVRLKGAILAGRHLVPGEVSAMLGVLVDGHPVASYICDVANRVTYTRSPYGRRILRVMSDGGTMSMADIPGKPSMLQRGTLLRHGARPITSQLTQALIKNAFGGVVQEKSSIGLSVIRILSGEFVGMVRPAGGYTTPWDDAPVMALCAQGSLVALRVEQGYLAHARLPLLALTPRSFDMLYVARQYLGELNRYVDIRAS